MKQSLFRSTGIHVFFLMVLMGCADHKPLPVVPQLSPEVESGRDFVASVADKMPLWDADAISKYERVEIATVKADIAVATTVNSEVDFLKAVAKLHEDWDSLVALDGILKHSEFI